MNGPVFKISLSGRLGNGLETLVDADDYIKYGTMKWRIDKENELYPRRKFWINGKKRGLLLHRLIMDAKKGQQVDHINRNSLDNRKENLRFCTSSQNLQNSRLSKKNTSGYKGVYFFKNQKKWKAKIYFNKKSLFLGHFNNKEDAARAYDKAAKEHFKSFANLNFK